MCKDVSPEFFLLRANYYFNRAAVASSAVEATEYMDMWQLCLSRYKRMIAKGEK